MNTLLKWLEWGMLSYSTAESKILVELIKKTKLWKFRMVLAVLESEK